VRHGGDARQGPVAAGAERPILGLRDAAEYAYEEIAGRFGVAPERMATTGVTGDAVDNIPGVPGSGRNAGALMSRYASLESCTADLDQIAYLPLAAHRGSCPLREHREAPIWPAP